MLGEDIEDFILNKGSLDIIYILANGPKSFDELKRLLKLSPNTILSRVREAQTLGIIEQKLLEETKGKSIDEMKGRSKIKYVLTKRGEKILEVSEGVKNRYLDLKKEIHGLQMNIRKKDSEIKSLLFPLQKPVAQILKSNLNQQ